MRNICIFILLATLAVPQVLGAAVDAPTANKQNPLLLPLLATGALCAVAIWLQLRAHKRLRAIQTMTGSMIDALSALIIGINAQQQVVEVNEAARNYLGSSREKIIGNPFPELFAELPVSPAMLAEVLDNQTGIRRDRVMDSKNERSWNILISPWNRGHDHGAILHLEERTEQARFEMLMTQKEKLFTVSRLAVGMIHEINNPLAGILQNMQVIHNRFGNELQKNRIAAENCGTSMEKISHYLQERGIDKAIEAVRSAARRAALVTETLVNFSRQDEEKETFHSLSTLLDRALDLAAGDFDLKQQYDFRRIRISREYDTELPPIRCHALKLQQAFFALLHFRAQRILNAPGTDEPRLDLKLFREGNQVRLHLEDNGPLLLPEERRKMFRPSLSEPGQGLGLCVSQFIICDIHGGTISFERSPDNLNRLVVRLPLEGLVHE